jgi:hypothetical protein
LKRPVELAEVMPRELRAALDGLLVDAEGEVHVGVAELLGDVDGIVAAGCPEARIGPPKGVGGDPLADRLNAQLVEPLVGCLDRILQPIRDVAPCLASNRETVSLTLLRLPA